VELGDAAASQAEHGGAAAAARFPAASATRGGVAEPVDSTVTQFL
jgi:hypothetical protein